MGSVAREGRIRIASSILICSQGGMSRRGRPNTSSSNHPFSSHSVTVQWTHRLARPHIARVRGCWCVCLHEYAQPLGFETSPWLIAVGGLPLPLCWRKWRGKKENERAQRSQRRRRGRLKGERRRESGQQGDFQCKARLFDGLLYPWPLPNLLSFYRSLSFLSLEDNKDGWHWCCAIRHYSPRLQSHLHHHLSPSSKSAPLPVPPALILL